MPPGEVRAHIARRGVLLDTNVLLLHLLVVDRPDLIGKKRLNALTLHTAAALRQVLPTRPRFVTTPHILAETSNLLRQMVPAKNAAERLAAYAAEADERSIPARDITKDDLLVKLGLADAVAARLALRDRPILLSIDAPLVGIVNGSGREILAVNLNVLWLD